LPARKILTIFSGLITNGHEQTRIGGKGDDGDHGFETRSLPRLLAAAHRGFTFHVADPVSSIHGWRAKRFGVRRCCAAFGRCDADEVYYLSTVNQGILTAESTASRGHGGFWTE